MLRSVRSGCGLVAALAALFLATCADLPLETETGAGGGAGSVGPVGPGPTGGGGDTDIGSFSMNLTVGSAVRFGEVSYTVSGNGFQKAGTVNVAGSSTVSTIIGGVPFGSGYVVQLTAQDLDHKLTPCTGSATFDVQSAALVQVPVHLICHEVPVVTADGGAGSAVGEHRARRAPARARCRRGSPSQSG